MDVLELFGLVAQLAQAVGAAPVNKLADCWEYSVDERWRLALNGHTDTKKGLGHNVEPFTLYVEFNGWPAGVLTPHGGEFAAGCAANEESFTKALRRAIERERMPQTPQQST